MVYYCFTHIISIPLLLAEETILVRVSALGATGKATRNLERSKKRRTGQTSGALNLACSCGVSMEALTRNYNPIIIYEKIINIL